MVALSPLIVTDAESAGGVYVHGLGREGAVDTGEDMVSIVTSKDPPLFWLNNIFNRTIPREKEKYLYGGQDVAGWKRQQFHLQQNLKDNFA